jgi:ribosomal protein S13
MLSFFLDPANASLNVFQVFIRMPNIGVKKIEFICKEIGIFKTALWSELSDKQVQKLSFWFEETFTLKHAVGTDFKKKSKDHFAYLKTLRNYKSFRLAKGLPARGQGTQNNAKTAARTKHLHF